MATTSGTATFEFESYKASEYHSQTDFGGPPLEHATQDEPARVVPDRKPWTDTEGSSRFRRFVVSQYRGVQDNGLHPHQLSARRLERCVELRMRGAQLLRRRLNVLIHTEHVLRIVLVFEGDQPFILLGTVGGANSLVVRFADEVQRHSSGAPRTHGLFG